MLLNQSSREGSTHIFNSTIQHGLSAHEKIGLHARWRKTTKRSGANSKGLAYRGSDFGNLLFCKSISSFLCFHVPFLLQI